jgi:hypothetical protein
MPSASRPSLYHSGNEEFRCELPYRRNAFRPNPTSCDSLIVKHGLVRCHRCHGEHSVDDLVLAEVNSHDKLEWRLGRIRMRYWAARVDPRNEAPDWILQNISWIWRYGLYPFCASGIPEDICFVGRATKLVGHSEVSASKLPALLEEVAKRLKVHPLRVRIPRQPEEFNLALKQISALTDSTHISMVDVFYGKLRPGCLYLHNGGKVTTATDESTGTCWVIVSPAIV